MVSWASRGLQLQPNGSLRDAYTGASGPLPKGKYPLTLEGRESDQKQFKRSSLINQSDEKDERWRRHPKDGREKGGGRANVLLYARISERRRALTGDLNVAKQGVLNKAGEGGSAKMTCWLERVCSNKDAAREARAGTKGCRGSTKGS